MDNTPPAGSAAVSNTPSWPRSGIPGLRWLATNRHAFLVFLLILAAWQISAAYVPEYIFPSIPKVFDKAVVLLGERATYDAILHTLQRVLGGFFLSAVVGVILGVAMAMWPRINNAFMPLLKFIMGVPALTWVLLSIIWFRSAELRVWFIMFVLVFPIVSMNTYDGVRSVPHELYHMVRSLRPSTAGLLRIVVVPAAMPFIFSGLKVSLSFGGRIAVFSEALSASTGIGAAMYTMNQVFDTAGIIVWTFILVGLLSLLDEMLGLIERRWFRWRREFQA
jgi:ABC-type nitrate/sulfonate/bicarbonate transport system permease component